MLGDGEPYSRAFPHRSVRCHRMWNASLSGFATPRTTSSVRSMNISDDGITVFTAAEYGLTKSFERVIGI